MNDTQATTFQRYLRVLLVWIPLVLLSVIGFNRLVDPYGLYPGPRFEGFNTKKPEFSNHIRMAKAKVIHRIRPRAIVLGTSRGEIGIDPQHPGWKMQPVYNLALSGGNIYEALRYLQHSGAIVPTQQTVLMLDFFMFNTNQNPDELDFDEAILSISFDEKTQRIGTRQFEILASLDAFFASLRTLRQDKDYHRRDGFRLRENDERSEKEQQRTAFLDNEEGYFNKHYHQFSFANHERDNLALFRKLLIYAHEHDIDLRIGISPSHARQFETIAAKGIWPLFENWKRHLVRINEEEAEPLGKPAFPIWDFSGYNSLTTEPVPPLGDTETEMRWYWESSHYKKELGDLVLDRIFDYQEPSRTVPDDFGVLLTSGNIEQHLAQVRADRERWRTAYPEDVAEIEALKTQPSN